MQKDRLSNELSETEDAGKVFLYLVQNGNLPSGPYVSVQDVSKAIGLPVHRVTVASMRLVQRHKRSWLDFRGNDSITGAHEYLYGETATGVIPDTISFFVRLSTEGIEDGLKDMTIRMQVKQLRDFDKAVSRSRTSIWISAIALIASIGGIVGNITMRQPTHEKTFPPNQSTRVDHNASHQAYTDTSQTDSMK